MSNRLKSLLDKLGKSYGHKNSVKAKIELLNQSPESTAWEKSIVRIGILPSSKSKSLTNSLVVDPFVKSNWFSQFCNRNNQLANIISYGAETQFQQLNHLSKCIIPASFLTGSQRKNVSPKIGGSVSSLDPHQFNNLQIWELSAENSISPETQGVDTLKLDKSRTHYDFIPCHLYIHLKSSPEEGLPLQYAHFPVISVVDTAVPFEAPDVIGVDLDSATESWQLLQESPQNSSVFLEKWKHSNFNLLLYRINELTTGNAPNACLLEELLKEVQGDLFNSESMDRKEALPEVEKFRQLSHEQLQRQVKPSLQQSMSKVSRLHEVLLKNDDLDLVMEKILSLNSSDHIDRFNFLKGKLNIDQTLTSSMVGLNKSVSSINLPLIQNSIHDYILKCVLTLNVPTMAVASWMNIYELMSFQTGLAIFVFSFMLAGNRISKFAHKTIADFTSGYTNELRMAIENDYAGLCEQVDLSATKVNEQAQLVRELKEEFLKLK